MTNGVLGNFWFRVLLGGKVIAFMPVIQAFKSRAARAAL